MKLKTINKNQYKKIIQTLKDFDDTINRYYSKKEGDSATKEFGYLIEKKLFDELKNKLGYSEIKNLSSVESIDNKKEQIYKNAQTINYKTSEQIIFKDYKELEEDLKTNKSEYIIVNNKIWDLFKKNELSVKNGNKNTQNKNQIKYEINEKNMILFLESNEKVFFKHDSNIIKYKNLLINENINVNSNNNDNINIKIIKKKKTTLVKLESKPKDDKNLINNKKEIMTILELFLLSKEIKKQIENKIKDNNKSSYFCGECYLIKDSWFSKYKNYYLYDEIYKYLDNKDNTYHEKDKEYKIKDLMQEFDDKLNKKNNNKLLSLLNNVKELNIDVKLNYEKKEMIFENRYIIINEDILKNLFEDNFDFTSIKKLKFCINNKIIIQNELKKNLFIGDLSQDINNTFIPEIILKFDEEKNMNEQFDFFINNNYSLFESYIDIKNKEKIDILISKDDSNKKIGEIFLIDKAKYNDINKYMENILKSIYNNDEEMTVMKQEKYFIINNKYIKKLKDLIKYDEYLKLLKENEKKDFNNIIIENKSKFNIEKNIIKTELENNDFMQLKKETINDNNSFYFKDFKLISKDLKDCLIDYDMFPKDFEIIEVKSQIKNDLFIIYPNLPDKYLAFICNLNDEKEYIIEFLYEFNDKTSLENYFNKTDNLNLKFENKKSDIIDDKGKKCGIAYEIIEKDKNEIIEEIKMKDDILFMIKIYLFNKDLMNKISLSKTEVNNEKNEEKIITFCEKCFLMDKEKMNLYKNYCLYDDLDKLLNDNINNIFKNSSDSKEELYSPNNIDNIYEYLKSNKKKKKYENKDAFQIDEKILDIKQKFINKENEITYYDDFIIVNEDIYKQHHHQLDIHNAEKKLIVNQGKIIIFFEEDNSFQALMGKLNSDNSNDIVYELLFNFNKLSSLKKFNQELLKEKFSDINKKLNKDDVSIFRLNFDIIDKIASFAALEINIERTRLRVKEFKASNKTNYYIINKKLFEYLNEYYDYDKIINKLKENADFNDYFSKIIKEDKNDNNNIITDKNSNKDKKANKKGVLKNLIKKIYEKEKMENIINQNLSSILILPDINPEIRNLNSDEKSISFYDEFMIVNDNFIKVLKLNILLDSLIVNPVKCLTDSKYIYLLYSLNEHCLINVGELNSDFIFCSKIIIEITNKEMYQKLLDDDNINTKIQKFVEKFMSDDSISIKEMLNIKEEHLGMAWKICKNDEKLLKENIIKEQDENNKEQNKINNIKFGAKENWNFNLINNNNINLNRFKFGLKAFKLKSNDNEINNNFHEKNDENKFINLFIILYLNYKNIEDNIKNKIKANSEKKYYLINKDFFKKYKKHYEFEKIANLFKSDRKIKENIEYYSELILSNINNKKNFDKYIDEIFKHIPVRYIESVEKAKNEQKDLLESLKKDKLNNISFSIEKIPYKIDKINSLYYYGENEIISREFLKLFNQLETDELKQLIQVEEINAFIGEENIFIISNKFNDNKYPFLTVGHYENNICNPYLLIYSYNNTDFSSLISKIQLWSFNKLISEYDIKNNNISEIKDSLSNIVLGKICKLVQNYGDENNQSDTNKNKYIFEDKSLIDKEVNIQNINSESIKFLKLIIFLKKIDIEKKSSIKNKDLKYGYPIKIDFLKKLQRLKTYQIIDNYMNQNINIKNIFEKLDPSENNIENILQKILVEFHEGIVNEINSSKESINEYSNFYLSDKERISLDKYNSIHFPNNFILLNEEIYNLFKSKFSRDYNNKEKLNYIIGDDRIFILLNESEQKNLILVYKSNKENNNIFELDLILSFNYGQTLCLNLIKESGFSKFSDYLLFDNDMVSPIFDSVQNIMGTAYKYSKEIKDYTDLNIRFDIKKMFLLYSNYHKLKKKLSAQNNLNKNEFSDYYIVNKDWLKEYKNYYNYDVISEEFNKIPLIQQVFNKLKDDEQISDKKLTLMIKAIPKELINIFNESENLFKTHYKNLNNRLPQLSGFEYSDNNNKAQSLFYFSDFELIEANIYNELFKNLPTNISTISDREIRNYLLEDENKKDNAKVQCLFEKNKIIIKFNSKSTDAGNKFILYIGKLNDSYIFEPEIFFLYDYNFYMDNHTKYILSYGGFDKFCRQLKSESKNSFELKLDNKICGIAVKRITNSFYINNNDNNINNNINSSSTNNNKNNLEPVENENKSKIDVIGKSIISKNNDNIINNNNIKSIKESFLYVPKIGLTNIGSTCYMNATLQCFCQIEEFASFFKYDNYVNIVSKRFLSKRENCLTSSFKKLIEKLWPAIQPREAYYSPNEFRQKIADMNPQFQIIGANDAKDLVNFIIMTLHEELNRSLSGTNTNNYPLNNMNNNRIRAYNLFLQDYNNTFKSKISEIFYAIQETETMCLSCKNIQYNCQAYFFLVFPLEEVKKYTINKINPSMNNNNMNNMKSVNNISLNNNNININLNMNFNMNNMSGNINSNMLPNINNNNKNNHQRSNSVDLYNRNMNMNMNTNMSNMMMNAGNNLIMNSNSYFMQNNNNIFNNMMPNPNNNMVNNMGMNFMNSNNNIYQNFNNYNMNNNPFINMPINNPFSQQNFYNNYGYGFTPSISNMNNVSNFNSMNSNLSNITMNNMFNMGMNNNINNANNINNNNISNMKLQKLYKNIVDISDCFEYNSKTDLFTEDNQIYCNNCHKMSNAYYSTNLETAPKVLILLLNRGKGIQFKIKLEFTMELDIGKYVNQKQANTNYKLIGVITHLGDNGESGHFIAHCLSPIDGEWYTYNDAIVSKIDDIKKQVVDLGMPYLLFYQRKE